jgi:O-antigen ligase
VALIFDGSRSYWLGFGMFLVLLVILVRKKRKEVWIIAFSLVLLGGVLINIPFLKHRVESITNTETNWSNLDRLSLWNAHLSAFFKDYSFSEKVFGAGYKASEYAWKRFPSSFEDVTGREPPTEEILKKHFYGGEAHNIYLKFLTKYGIFGLLGYIAFWLVIFYENLRKKTEYDVLTKTLLSGYAGFLVAGFFENNFTDAEVQFALMFILGLNFALLQIEGWRIGRLEG